MPRLSVWNRKVMTIADLDDLIRKTLASGPKTIHEIHAEANFQCSMHDMQAALRIWVRQGWARELGTGAYATTPKEAA
jgi:hypothetical protein